MRKKNLVKRKLKEAKGSLAVEGLYTTKTEDQLIKRRLMGEITEKEFLRRAKELASLSPKKMKDEDR
ncbi:hypothetical protein SAMN05444487_11629 [Marininema mesophilum]|uniref:Antitoxin VbhA domain-containing protein n=1 Tax=Marininema mesophilum TaxID=1048340 RepID=A0A1H3BB61_9BACL|nr:hypothetical protein [Marininema mesophilum]SDX38881.1 hypothetical protein SAMN05444487_11629 [Marininema mesophilum]